MKRELSAVDKARLWLEEAEDLGLSGVDLVKMLLAEIEDLRSRLIATERGLDVGMYTGFKAKVVVKERWRGAIELLHRESCGDPWLRVSRAFPGLPGIRGWTLVGRRDFIPFGVLCYLPDEFSPEGRSYSNFDTVSGVWEFCCSLKNYEDEIDTFIQLVLSQIIESYEYCVTQYECDLNPTHHELKIK